MKFTSKLALTSLLLALGASSSALADSRADITSLVNQLNTYLTEAQQLGNLSLSELQFYKTHLDVAAYNQADQAGKVAYVQQLYNNANAYVTDADKNNSGTQTEDPKYEQAKEIVARFAQPAQAVETYSKLLRYYELDQLSANAYIDLHLRIYTNPGEETSNNLRALNLVDAQQHLNLLNTLTQQPSYAGFANWDGASVAGDGAKASSNRLVAGYKYQLPYLPVPGTANVAGFGALKFAQGSVSGNSTNKFDTATGLGLYADYSFLGARLAVLGATSSTQVTVHNSADFASIVGQVVESYQAKMLQSFAKYSLDASAKVRDYNGLVKVDYTYLPIPKLSLTPGLFYQYHAYKVSDTSVTLTEAHEYFQEGFKNVTKYAPLFQDQIAHRWGATFDVAYQLKPNVSVGGDLAVVYSKESLGKRFAYEIQNGHEMPNFYGKEYNSSSMTYALQAKASYNLRPEAEITAKVGYLYFSDVKQSGATYGLNFNYRF